MASPSFSFLNTNNTATNTKELLDAHSHVMSHIFSFLKSMALKCAIQLGIPDAIHKHGNGNPMPLSTLINTLNIHTTKISSFYRIIRFLTSHNFLSQTEVPPNNEQAYSLTPSSRLLVSDNPLSLGPFALGMLDLTMVEPSFHLETWLKSKEEESPFYIAHGKEFWEQAGYEPKMNEYFNKAMASDSMFNAKLLLGNEKLCKVLFEGIESIVDVGGGNGTMLKAITKSYPTLKCTVFDLPHVVERYVHQEQNNNNAQQNLTYVGGDMFKTIPSANVVLLKLILHDWNDKDCIKILERSKEAIPSKEQGGKIIIIDIIMVENKNYNTKELEAQVLADLEMMSLTGVGRERTEDEWKKLIENAGFSEYKIYYSALGVRSVIEVYP